MNTNKFLFLIILLIGCLSQFASDIYAPALPAIAANLHTQIKLAQFSMAIYMFGVALSLLIYGPLSEGLGRKIPLGIGLGIMLAGSVICWFTPSIEVLIAGRFIQGLGAGACAGLWRAVFRDVFSGALLAKYGSYFTLFVVFVVPAAPTLGSYLLHWLDWRAIFAFMSLYITLTLLLVVFGFKDTSRHHHQDRLKFAYIRGTFLKLLTNRIFIGITLCTFLSYGAFFAWFTAGPVLLIHVTGMSPVTFGWISFIGCGSAYALAGWLNGRLVTRFGMANMLRLGWTIMAWAGLLMLLGKFALDTNVWNIVPPAILFCFGSTFIWPNAFATALTPFGEIAGYAGSLYSFMQMSGAAVIGSLVAHLPDVNQLPLAGIFIAAPLLAWIVYEVLLGRLYPAQSKAL